MITRFDDYPIHQTPAPIAEPATTDRNAYDRYWFNGFAKDGGFYFGFALGRYPNRFVQDAHFSVSIGDKQYSLHASRRAPKDPVDLNVGPVTLEVLEPMKILRLRIEPNTTQLACDLTFTACTVPHGEPRAVLRQDARVVLDATRFVQYGVWEGWFSVHGQRTEVRAEQVLAVRDRSWGVRPVGEIEAGAPPQSEYGVYWVWNVNHFENFCTHFGSFESPNGEPILPVGALLQKIDQDLDKKIENKDTVEDVTCCTHNITWQTGTRWPRSATFHMQTATGAQHDLVLTPLRYFWLKGLGYLHPKWAHGVWQGESALEGEVWCLDEVPVLDPFSTHVHALCRVQMGEHEGIGTLETLVLGRHTPSGFKEFLDGAE